MRKNDLIKKLEAIEGNPEIKLWNGLVGDWMDIGNLTEDVLVKYNFKHWLKMCRLEDARDANDWSVADVPYSDAEMVKMKALHKKHQWEYNQFVTDEDISNKFYDAKRIVSIDAKRRGNTYMDRLGNIQY